MSTGSGVSQSSFYSVSPSCAGQRKRRRREPEHAERRNRNPYPGPRGLRVLETGRLVSGVKIQRVRWPQRYLSVLLLIPAVIIGCGGSGEGRVLAEGKHLGEFEASPNPFKFDAAHARRFVITKVEVFGAGQLNGFPGQCSGGACAAAPGKRPVVLHLTRAGAGGGR